MIKYICTECWIDKKRKDAGCRLAMADTTDAPCACVFGDDTSPPAKWKKVTVKKEGKKVNA